MGYYVRIVFVLQMSQSIFMKAIVTMDIQSTMFMEDDLYILSAQIV